MKTIINNIRFALLLGFITIGMTALAQAIPNANKMSISTQMFMDEMAGRISFDQQRPIPPKSISPGMKPLPIPKRPIVDPDTIDNRAYISATVRITSENDIAALEQIGVIIQCKFDKGLMTTLIPIDKIEEVAAIEGVTRINVASYMRPLTNLARQATNVDDLLTLSQDARDAGLLKKYDGSGIILGIIDDGIDFQHKAFTDKNGNTRIKRAYCYNGSTVTDWTGSGSLPTTDDSSEDHGTHTSSIAGGSSVVVSGTNVTVTDDHSAATYGGMAPGADLFLAGTQLATTYILNSFQKMAEYADAQGKPLVVSNSWGSSIYARDGYSDMSDVLAQYFGDNNPNHICLFATGNEAGMANGGQGGGRYVTGTASQASPLGTILRSPAWLEDYGYQYYSGWLANAWTRGTNCTGIGINIYVINKNTGAISNTYNYTSTNSAGTYQTVTLGGINMSVRVYFDYVASNNKHQVALRATNYKTTSNYVIAIEVYPIGGTNSTVDIYGGDYTYLTGYVNTSGHNWQYGSDDLSMGDEAMDPSVISVGSYVTRYGGENSVGDISDFSSYAAEGVGPTGVMHPWITAPGEVIISAINHYVSSGNHGTVTVNNSTAPYGEMSGTSMATPAAAGIVALWMEAAQEVDKTLTTSDVKNIMALTAIHDQWTSGANSSHFGNGKINALAGVEYILSQFGIPTIKATPMTVNFDGIPGTTYTQTVSVKALMLSSGITVTLNDPNGVYSVTPTNLSTDGGQLVITFTPNEEGEYNATITLTSPGAEPVTITISGIAMNHTSTLFSNEVMVPVYKSDIRANGDTYIFSESDVLGDIDMNLEYPANSSSIEVLAKSDEPILRYELHHKIGAEGDWTYPNGNAVGIATHDGNSYVVNSETFTFPQDATEMWISMTDGQLNNASEVTYYVPVTVANGKVTTGEPNTYGAPIGERQLDPISIEVQVGGVKSSTVDHYGNHTGEWVGPNGINYCVYMPAVTVMCQQLNGATHVPYMYRAWLLANENIDYYNYGHDPKEGYYGTTVKTMPYLLAQMGIEDVGSDPTRVVLCEAGDTYEGQNTFGAPVDNPDIVIAVRVYYQRADETRGHTLRAGSGYGFGQGSGRGDGIITGVNELLGGKQVVDVQYVNTLGMQSNEPFDGVNIVITRYSDGSTSTAKVVK